MKEGIKQNEKNNAYITDFNYEMICRWCANRQDRVCLADVPNYCVSINCRNWLENSTGDNKKQSAINKIIKNYLVDTL